MPVHVGEPVPADLEQSLAAAVALDGAGLAAAYPVALASGLDYDPMAAQGLDTLQASALALDSAQLEKLGQNGFVIAKGQQFPTFGYGYKTIYSQDLPVYISADSILFAVHRTYDGLLGRVESAYMRAEVQALLEGMRARLPGAGLDPVAASDVDLYLAVAESLITGTDAAPVAGADAATVASLAAQATAGSGHATLSLFGEARDEDFSQFTPRGHYTETPELGRYFRTLIWLGRVDLRLIETLPEGEQRFNRRQFDALLGLRAALGPAEEQRWSSIDAIISAFAGERDAMAFSDLDGLLDRIGAHTPQELAALPDDTIVDALSGGGFGVQRIASRLIVNDTSDGHTLPLDLSFAFLGQRYTVDSHVFVNTTFDRVSGRLMPDPLDAAFAALGNDAALGPLTPGFDNQPYVAGLAKTRVLVDAHEPAYWDSSLYTDWLSALRALSPPGDVSSLPSVARTRAFQNRILNTQLASWAELRHDTILYAKQSYTGGTSCEFPDAYVDPYPELYARLGAFAERVRTTLELVPDGSAVAELHAQVADWVTNFETAMGYLEQMAEDQRSGTPHSQASLDFVNEAVRWDEQEICGGTQRTNLSGWYFKLFLDPYGSLTFDPTIADVHTQPTDEDGNDVGRILHVGTGYARLLVTTVDTCTGPRAYVGLVSSYAQTVEEGWTRLTDEDWASRVQAGAVSDVPWLGSVLAE